MQTLWSQIQENALFLLVSLLIAAAIWLLAKLAEKGLPEVRRVTKARRITIIALCAAMATVLHVLDFPIPFLAPEFYKLDFSEIPVLFAGFFLGPSAAVATEGIKILLKLLLKSTSTAFVGDFANFVIGCTMVLPAVAWYHRSKSKHSALVGLILGTVVMTVFGSAFNAVYLLPKFAQLFGMPLDTIIAMGAKLHGGVSDVYSFAALCVAPLNLLKGASVSVLTMLLYKRLAEPLFQISQK